MINFTIANCAPEGTAMTQTLPIIEAPTPPEVFDVRGQSVVLDADLARLFQVETRSLNQQVQRNLDKFETSRFDFLEMKSRF